MGYNPSVATLWQGESMMRKWVAVVVVSAVAAGIAWAVAVDRGAAQADDPEGAQAFDRELARGVRRYEPPPEAADGMRMEQARQQMESAYGGRK